MVGVNSEICEQMFRWTAKYKFAFNHMNEESGMFFLLNVILGRNRFCRVVNHFM